MAILSLHRFLCRAVLIASIALCGGARGDSLQTADSLEGFPVDALWADSAAALADTLHTGAVQHWWYPLGLTLVTVTVIYLLFAVRSK